MHAKEQPWADRADFFLIVLCVFWSLTIRLAGARLTGYLTPVTIGERIVGLPAQVSADTRRAEVFYSSLAQLRAELCDQLDEETKKLARCERLQDLEAVRRKHRRIKDIGADIGEIDRMIRALNVGLLDRRRARPTG